MTDFYKMCEYIRVNLPNETTEDIIKKTEIFVDESGISDILKWDYAFAKPDLSKLPNLSDADITKNTKRHNRDIAARDCLNDDNIQIRIMRAMFEALGGPLATGKNFRKFALDAIGFSDS